MLSRDQILGASDLPTETVDVPEWGGQVIVRSMTGAERDRFELSLYSGNGRVNGAGTNGANGADNGAGNGAGNGTGNGAGNGKVNAENIRARLVALTTIDEAGNRLFDDGDVEALGAKSAAALARVFTVAQRLNALSGSDVEELEKN